MSSKRARIADSNPFTATDGVLAGYEQANKSSHQPVESKSDTQQVEKSASQPANNLTPQEVEELDFQEVSKPTSQQANKPTSQEVDKSTSQQSDQSIVDRILGNPTTEEVNNLTSQQVDTSKLTSQEVNKLAIEEVSKSTSQEVDQPELDDRGLERQSQLVKPVHQEVNQPILRKATYQIDAAVLEALDRYHLQLQIDLGRRNAPHKETLVEEAIVQWLERTAKSPDRAVKSLVKRQEQR
jgi:hypothetical protein